MEDGLVLVMTKPYIENVASVLILVVMEDGLVLVNQVGEKVEAIGVLILVVMEDGLVQFKGKKARFLHSSLNPCCNGRWSRTYE